MGNGFQKVSVIPSESLLSNRRDDSLFAKFCFFSDKVNSTKPEKQYFDILGMSFIFEIKKVMNKKWTTICQLRQSVIDKIVNSSIAQAVEHSFRLHNFVQLLVLQNAETALRKANGR